MKKIIVILLLCFCFLAGGCSSGSAGLVLNSNGTVLEYYYVPIPEQELEDNGVSRDEVTKIIMDLNKFVTEDNPFIIGDGIFAELMNNYQQKLLISNKYTMQEKTAMIKGVTNGVETINENNKCVGVRFYFKFANSICYNEFKNINEYIKEDRVIEETSNLFTTTTKVVKDPIFDKLANDAISIGTKCLSVANTLMENNLGADRWEEIKQKINYEDYASKFEYTYVVPTARVHTNADLTEKDAKGYYYHTWNVNINNIDNQGNSIIKIEYWTVSANVWVWYVLTLIIASGVMITIYFVGKNKEKNEEKTFKVEYNDGKLDK